MGALIQRSRNPVQARALAYMLEETIHRYRSHVIEPGQVVEEWIGLAKDIREAEAPLARVYYVAGSKDS